MTVEPRTCYPLWRGNVLSSEIVKNTTVWKPERLYSIRSDTLRKVMWSRLPGVASDHVEKQKKQKKSDPGLGPLCPRKSLQMTSPNASKNYTFVRNGLFGTASAHMLFFLTVLVLILRGFRLLGSAEQRRTAPEQRRTAPEHGRPVYYSRGGGARYPLRQPGVDMGLTWA